MIEKPIYLPHYPSGDTRELYSLRLKLRRVHGHTRRIDTSLREAGRTDRTVWS